MNGMPSGQSELMQVGDPELLDYLEQRIIRTAEEFNVDPGSFPRPVILIERPNGSPENIRLPGGPCLIFITTTSDWHRARYQIAHEVVHGLLSPTVEAVFDWVQEMFAVHIAVRAMRELGEYQYVGRSEAGLWERSGLLPRELMQAIDLQHTYPDGLYGQAFVTGCELIDQIGWERLKLLGTQMNKAGRHDIPLWLELLDKREQAAVRRVLRSSTEDQGPLD